MNGKGSRSRVTDPKAFGEGYDRIFGKIAVDTHLLRIDKVFGPDAYWACLIEEPEGWRIVLRTPSGVRAKIARGGSWVLLGEDGAVQDSGNAPSIPTAKISILESARKKS